MDKFANEGYRHGYIDGYLAAAEKHKVEEDRPYIDVEGIMRRYDVGINKARNILQAVRHCCNGGKLDSSSRVLLSEIKYWESVVDKQFLARL